MPQKSAADETASKNRDVTLNIRVQRPQRDLLDQAAEVLGTTRSAFMLSAACRAAENVLLDKRIFSLSAEDFKRFEAALDSPPADNPGLEALLKLKSPW